MRPDKDRCPFHANRRGARSTVVPPLEGESKLRVNEKMRPDQWRFSPVATRWYFDQCCETRESITKKCIVTKAFCVSVASDQRLDTAVSREHHANSRTRCSPPAIKGAETPHLFEKRRVLILSSTFLSCKIFLMGVNVLLQSVAIQKHSRHQTIVFL